MKKFCPKGSGGGETPPVVRKRQSQDVKKILRRLSLNIPPPTPEEIENQNKQVSIVCITRWNLSILPFHFFRKVLITDEINSFEILLNSVRNPFVFSHRYSQIHRFRLED